MQNGMKNLEKWAQLVHLSEKGSEKLDQVNFNLNPVTPTYIIIEPLR